MTSKAKTSGNGHGKQAKQKPNILVIWGDDIGFWNISAYNQGMMGYRTPNIDRIAKQGAMMTDCYGQQSCTAGRAAFITGMNPLRTGLTTIGMPGAKYGLQDSDPTIAEMLKPLGYTCGQFGKNHLGDSNPYLPTHHGFDEFFGNLYHLNAENEPECPDYPKDPSFKARFGPRGVLHSWATSRKDVTEDPRWGLVGGQRIEDTGPLTKKRMETVDGEFLEGALGFMERAVEEGKPFFLWHNTTRTHVWTFLQEKYRNATGYGLYADAMRELDDIVGALLDKLDELGIADNTLVVFSTDNGVEKMGWPDGGNSPFRGEKGSTWEGGVRVPCVVRWPGVVEPGRVINDIFAHEDWMPTLVAAAGGPADLVEKCKGGYKVGHKTFRVHLDGYDQTGLLAGTEEGRRNEFIYVLDSGDLAAVRYKDWKIIFSYQDGEGPDMWFSGKRFSPAWPYLINLRSDPFEYGPHSGLYTQWYGERMFTFVPAQMLVKQFAESLIEFLPSQAPGSLSIGPLKERVKQKMAQARKQHEEPSVGDQVMSLANEVEQFIHRFQQSHH
ncbi:MULTISPECIES: arylsulfatase [unclassified Corallococcus]|uniref:arylsulfatase n=1 Tax=unclassified Corallococcus TaxID=2685029 RepID=UPI001A8EF556|nr:MULTISPECIES: arylsulfatase [unclassified Corallococcus]MBN9682986.1 arylsulfatase [Corallococcus sp. NCSPR001]WAS85478.1 arylsulfatase [Corallococcus sp. NCRR]